MPDFLEGTFWKFNLTMTQKMKITYSDGSTKIEDKVVKIEPYEEPKKIYANWPVDAKEIIFGSKPISQSNQGGFTEKEALISRLKLLFKWWPDHSNIQQIESFPETIKELAKRL